MLFFHHQVCYYLKLRFQNINKQLKEFLQIKQNDKKLKKILIDYNDICVEVNRYNYFWNYYIFIEYFFSGTIICLILYMAFFASMVLWFKVICMIYVPVFMSILMIVSLSCSMVSKKVLIF